MINTSVLHYPDRGPWGDPSFRGNATGHLLKDLIEHYHAFNILDPMEGSGTSGHVCETLEKQYTGEDLAQNKDARMIYPLDLEEEFDLIYLHPPYHDIIPYSKNINDLSNQTTYDNFLSSLHTVINAQVRRLKLHGYMALLIGDFRKHGIYYSPFTDIFKWFHSNLRKDAILIKEQRMVTSDQTQYTGNFIRIMHEFCIVWEKV